MIICNLYIFNHGHDSFLSPIQVIVMIGAMAHATARFFFIFAREGWVLYLGAAVSSLGPIVAPVLRSMTSKIVPLSERGKVFALLSVFDNCVPLFSGVLYTQVNTFFKLLYINLSYR